MPSVVVLFSLFTDGLLLGIASYREILSWAEEGIVENKYINDRTISFVIEINFVLVLSPFFHNTRYVLYLGKVDGYFGY